MYRRFFIFPNVHAMPEVSAIIPVHNGHRHIKPCIKSIQNQSFKDLEIIIVDDDSADNSTEICHKLAETDSRIKIITNSRNEGPYKSRMNGIKIASGNYMTFVDCDDYLARNAIMHMLNHTKKTHSDIAVIGHCYSFTRFNIHAMHNNAINRLPYIINNDLLKASYMRSFLGDDNLIPVSMCAKLYNAKLMHRRWKECNLKWGEDRIFSLQAFHHANKCVTIPEYGYYYRWGGSTCKHELMDYLKYDSYMEEAMKIADSLDYDSLIPLLKSRNYDYFLYHVRNCILDLQITRQEILDIISTKTKLPVTQAHEIYTSQLSIIRKHMPKYVTRLILDRL